MGLIIKKGIEFSGGGGGDNSVQLTQAEYDALPDSKLTDDITYYITDGEGGGEGGAGIIKVTQAEYDALSEEEKNNGKVYFVTDADEMLSAHEVGYNDTTVEAELDSLNLGLADKATKTELTNLGNNVTTFVQIGGSDCRTYKVKDCTNITTLSVKLPWKISAHLDNFILKSGYFLYIGSFSTTSGKNCRQVYTSSNYTVTMTVDEANDIVTFTANTTVWGGMTLVIE